MYSEEKDLTYHETNVVAAQVTRMEALSLRKALVQLFG